MKQWPALVLPLIGWLTTMNEFLEFSFQDLIVLCRVQVILVVPVIWDCIWIQDSGSISRPTGGGGGSCSRTS